MLKLRNSVAVRVDKQSQILLTQLLRTATLAQKATEVFRASDRLLPLNATWNMFSPGTTQTVLRLSAATRMLHLCVTAHTRPGSRLSTQHHLVPSRDRFFVHTSSLTYLDP